MFAPRIREKRVDFAIHNDFETLPYALGGQRPRTVNPVSSFDTCGHVPKINLYGSAFAWVNFSTYRVAQEILIGEGTSRRTAGELAVEGQLKCIQEGCLPRTVKSTDENDRLA